VTAEPRSHHHRALLPPARRGFVAANADARRRSAPRRPLPPPATLATTADVQPTTSPSSPPFYAGKRAVVVGAGPAGSAVAMMLAAQGFTVDVYDRRPEPRDDAVDVGRAYVIIAIPRGRKVLDDLGVALTPEAEQALLVRPAAAAAKAAADPSSSLPPPRAGTVRHSADGKVTASREDGNVQLSRSALAQALIDAARERYGKGSEGGGGGGKSGSIAFHWNWSAEGGADLRRRRVTFERTADGGNESSSSSGGKEWRVAPYDLLVGADGAGSAVRAAFAEQQADAADTTTTTATPPPFSFTVEDTGREYKTYSNAPGGPGIFEEPEGLEGAATLHLWRPRKPPRGKAARWDKFASFTAHSNPDGTYSGTMALRKGMHANLEAGGAAGYASLLREAFAGVPEAWVGPISQQLAAGKARGAGRRIRCSRLWDGAKGRAVLIGDAAHGVSPVFGQGMNSSLETAAVLARVLRECAAEAEARADAADASSSPVDAALDAAPRRFDAERREDAHALVALDRKAFSFFGAGPKWDAFQLLAHVVLGSLLGRVAPFLYGGRRRPALLSLGSPDTSYGQILRDVRRDAAVVAAGLVALAAWLVGKFGMVARGEALLRGAAAAAGFGG
jgi:ubiquitin carboxyl-terminal hydrolase 48